MSISSIASRAPEPTVPFSNLKELYYQFTLLRLAINGLVEISSHSLIDPHEVAALARLSLDIDAEFQRFVPAEEGT